MRYEFIEKRFAVYIKKNVVSVDVCGGREGRGDWVERVLRSAVGARPPLPRRQGLQERKGKLVVVLECSMVI